MLYYLTYFVQTFKSTHLYCQWLFDLYDTAVPKHTFICVQNRRALYICRIDVCINTAPDLPWNKQYHDHCSFVSECTTWCISTVPPENPGVRTRRIISVSAHRTLQNPLHLYRSIFSGRNCAALTQIYFNTQHNIWTNKTKRRRAFYILLSRSKKINKNMKWEHWGIFYGFANSTFWCLACNVWCITLP